MGLRDAIQRSFVAGLILIAPLVITVYVLKTLVGWSLKFINPIVAGTRLTQYTANDQLAATIIAALLIVFSITLLGYLAQMNVGRQLFGNAGRIVNVIPLVSTVYSSVRQVANSFVDRDEAYESVVVEYPHDGIYAIGLVTGDSPVDLDEFEDEPVYNVYLPNSPNPTGGRLALVPESALHETDMSVRAGMRLLVTTGVTENGESRSIPGSVVEEEAVVERN